MNVIPEPIPGGSALARDYIERYEQVSNLYGGDFRDEEGRRRRAEWLDGSEQARADRADVAACLRSYNAVHNPHEAVQASLALLEQPGTLVVTGAAKRPVYRSAVCRI